MSSHEISNQLPDLTLCIQTLTTAGFWLEQVDRKPGYALIFASQRDEFGSAQPYCFALSDGSAFNANQVEAARIAAQNFRAQLVFIGSGTATEPVVSWDRFLGLFGGPIYSTSPFDHEFAERLTALGRNTLPPGLVGTPDDLFEAYVRVAFEFIIGTRVIRYGQDRRFEKKPDGLILPQQNFTGLFDAKAYSHGFEVTADSLRQFAAYVRDFQQRYAAYLPRLHAFIVVSGSFVQGSNALSDRSKELQSDCGVPLSFLSTVTLVEIITMIAANPRARHSVNWPRVFADAVVSSKRVKDELKAIQSDGIVRT